MKIIVAHDDMDGITAKNVLTKYALEPGEEALYYLVDYTFDHRHLIENHGPGDMLFILDFSFKAPVLAELVDHFGQAAIVWIDHHKVIEDIKETYPVFLLGLRRIGTSGALLTYEYCQEEYDANDPDVLNVCEIVDAYDCWKKDSPLYEKGCLMNTYFYAAQPSLSEMILEVVEDFPKGQLLDSAFRAEAAKRCKDKAYEVVLLDRVNGTWRTHFGKWIAMEGVRGSRNFDSMTNRSDYNGMLVYQYNGKVWTVSLYSEREDVDCAEICKVFGGGGHKGAAGFTATTTQMIERGIF